MSKILAQRLLDKCYLEKMNFIAHYPSPIGSVSLASDGESLTGLWFDGQKYDRGTLRGSSFAEKDLPVFSLAKKWLDIYFSGKAPNFTPPLKVEGSAFKKLVSEIMREIPFGRSTTYGEIARKVAQRTKRKSMSAQAVGLAVGRNPISIIVPCHRVLGTGGRLVGYAGGIERKVFLLKNEGFLFQNDSTFDRDEALFVLSRLSNTR